MVNNLKNILPLFANTYSQRNILVLASLDAERRPVNGVSHDFHNEYVCALHMFQFNCHQSEILTR